MAGSLALALGAIAMLETSQTLDRCLPLVPAALGAQVTAAFPGYRLARGSDQDEFNVRYNLEHGGSGCLGIAEGDFDGDKRGDIAFLLSATQGPETLIVVALRRAGPWVLERVDTWEGPSSLYYLDTASAGAYESPFYGESSPRPNELRSIKSTTEGVVAGQLESTALYYFRVDGHWRFVWMSD